MSDVKKKVQDFNALPYEQRLGIVNNIINNLAEKGNTQAQEIKTNLSIIPHPSDHLLETIYTDFENGVEKIQQGKLDDSVKGFEASQYILEQIRRKEQEVEGDNDADALLEGIE